MLEIIKKIETYVSTLETEMQKHVTAQTAANQAVPTLHGAISAYKDIVKLLQDPTVSNFKAVAEDIGEIIEVVEEIQEVTQ